MNGGAAGFIHFSKNYPKIDPKMVEKGVKMEPNGSKTDQNQSQNRILTLDGPPGAWATPTVAKKEDFGAFWGTIFGAFRQHPFWKFPKTPTGPEKVGCGTGKKWEWKANEICTEI